MRVNADQYVYDAATVGHIATYAAPHAYPSGIAHVIVNGVAVVSAGQQTEARPGQVLRHQQGPPYCLAVVVGTVY